MVPELARVVPADEYNQTLLENVHPSVWTNPAPSGKYNLVVIGAGTAGLVSAAGAAGLGAKVALIEKQFLGGDCLNYGCVPSKALIRAARVAQTVREASQYGVHVSGGFRIDFGQAMERMRRLRSEISEHDSAQRFRSLGVDVFLGEGRFTGRSSLEVEGQKLEFSRAIIATGARAAHPAIPGLTEAGFLTNETVFSLTELPRRLCVIGAGPIGCEMAQAFRRLGSEVCIITHGTSLLPKEDRDAAAIIHKRFEQEGIEIVLGARIARVEAIGGSRQVVLEKNAGEERVVSDQILVAIGRTPNVEGLNLEAAGIAYDQREVRVDDHLRTTNSRVYAAGDICSRFKFTHAADAMARLALRNALFFGRGKTSSLVIPWCTFTDPEVAHVGLDLDEAGKRGHNVVTHTVNLAEVDRAVLDGATDGFARVHVDKKSGKILGATLISEHAGETISEFVLAMGQGIPLSAFSSTIHPYPTQAEAVKRLGDLSMRARLKPWVRKVFTAYFKIWR
ncbi:MAG TPA: mercuric reductase [Acidobacteriaceae bacterium]|nr:mercuric reductase [Acidobacteriaceae bacterium]